MNGKVAKRVKEKSHILPKNISQRLTVFPADLKPRIFFFFLAVVVQLSASALSGVGYTLHKAGYWVAGMILWLTWFFLMFVIISPQSDNFLHRYTGFLKRLAIIIFIALLVVGIGELVLLGIIAPRFLNDGVDNSFNKIIAQLEDGLRYNDGTALCQQAAENLMEGKEPYSNSNIITAFNKYNGAWDRITPLQLGKFTNDFPYPSTEQIKQSWDNAVKNPAQPPPEIESRVCYPAGSFLLLVPFLAAGINDIRYIYIILVLAALAYAIWKIPGKRRLIFIALVMVSLELWNTLATGETGILIFPLLLIAWISLGENNWLSAIFMGLAVATKQTAWFFLPFYVILLWYKSRPKTVAITIGIIAAVFAITNGYFIAKNPSLWLASITAPMVEPMFPLGVGFVSLVTSGLADIHTSLPFTIAEGIVFIGGIIWYLRNARRYPEAGPILSILPLFFAWRSIWTYFYYIAIIILARMLIERKNNTLPQARVLR